MMHPLNSAAIAGTWAAVLIPFEESGRIDRSALETEIDILCAAGVDGIYAHGTSGEPYTLTDSELGVVDKLVAEAAETAGISFQLGAGRTEPSSILERARALRYFDPGAIQVVLPDWVAVSNIEAVDFLTRLARITNPIPLVIYNPPHAKRVLNPLELRALVDAVPGLAGVKTGAGDAQWYTQAAGLLGCTSVFVPGHQLATGHRYGAAGSYSNIAALSPKGAVAWWSHIQRDDQLALDIERRIGEFFAAEIEPLKASGIANPALDKFLAAVGDWGPVTPQVRWPYTSVPGTSIRKAAVRVRQLLPELFTV